MPFRIIRNDITKVAADAIVNTANPRPVYAGGTDAAVYRAAGVRELLAERKKIGDIPVGEVAVTSAFRLHAKYIIHTVGPIWWDGEHGEFDALASCYRKSLQIAAQLRCESIAFPLISTGTYGFPRDQALQIALKTIEEFLRSSDMEVVLVVFDRKSFVLSGRLVSDVHQYIDENYASKQGFKEYEVDRRDSRAELERRRQLWEQQRDAEPEPAPDDGFVSNAFPEAGFSREDALFSNSLPGSGAVGSVREDAPRMPEQAPSLEDVLGTRGDSFHAMLFRLIDRKGMKDSDVWHKANISHKLFSKIRCNENYTPSKKTALALAIALELNLDQTVDLLGRAGLALSPSSVSDLIIKYCIQNGIYNMFEIDALLFNYGMPTMGSDE